MANSAELKGFLNPDHRGHRGMHTKVTESYFLYKTMVFRGGTFREDFLVIDFLFTRSMALLKNAGTGRSKVLFRLRFMAMR